MLTNTVSDHKDHPGLETARYIEEASLQLFKYYHREMSDKQEFHLPSLLIETDTK